MSSNTVNTIQKMTPDGTHIGDSRITDNGTEILAGSTDVNLYINTTTREVDTFVSDGTDQFVSTGSVVSGWNVTATSSDGGTEAAIDVTGNAGTSIELSTDSSTGQIKLVAGAGIAQSAPASTTAGILANGQISFWIDQVGNTLKVAVKYSDGTTKTGTIALL